MPKVYWALMKERHGAAYEEAFDAITDVIEYTARLKDFHRIVLAQMETAHARNAHCQVFYYTTENPDPNDTLVMLDADHVFQKDIVEKIAAHEHGVVGAMATTRGEIPFVPFWKRGEDGKMYNLTEWEDGEIIKGTLVGTGTIAIKRWVLEKLKDSAPSWFRYTYKGYNYEASEDMYFGFECEKHGIPHYLDTNLWIPHCLVYYTTPADWRDYMRDNPKVKNRIMGGGNEKDAPKVEKEIVTGGDKWEQIQKAILQTA